MNNLLLTGSLAGLVGCETAPGGGHKKRDSLGTAGSAHLIIKDLGEIHSRLLDHRPVIQGETRYFVKEFEGVRSCSVTRPVCNGLITPPCNLQLLAQAILQLQSSKELAL
ncbi:biogenesis of lysosome-related organelles complex 1 subunit 5-like [Nycticebus coucang]|uniref:biogenesis of lysosome-related organelles complex 1 subunit 5-like n=1 Tax=Nycticebus coucang TaxID=9470 RepID=UPI00234DC0CB|nr:biogenesis of lysosome-related organelles complex 1 subunit 5-like [Nycticebus coucang]